MGMEKYMGYPFRDQQKKEEPPHPLPEVSISGTSFYVDMNRSEFRQVDNPANRILFIGIKEETGFQTMHYDERTKNHYAGDVTQPANIPAHVKLVLVPPLKMLDPAGLAKRQGLPVDYHSRGNKREKVLVLPAFSQAVRKGRKPAGKRISH